jgi:hypothetical protein
VNDPVTDGDSCDDGLFCTVDDSCTSGQCGGTARDCSSLTNQCNQGICDEDGNQCLARPANEGQTCDDGLYCSLTEICQSGSCVEETPRDCQNDDPCTQGHCEEASNTCQQVLVPRPGQENLNIPGTCTDGLDNDCDILIDGDDPDCMECSQDSDCDDLNVCTINTCGADNHCQTDFVTDGTTCDDGLQCTDADACSAGVCAGTPLDCSSLDDDCNRGFCNETSGQCEPQAINEGQACEDGLYCNTGETCQAGSCTGGGDRDCSAEDDDCNQGVCDEGSGSCVKQPANDGAECDDGLYCIVGETCSGGVCSGVQARDCTHLSDECNDGNCDEDNDLCIAVQKTDGTECGSRSCSGTDWMKSTCISGACTGTELQEACDNGVFCDGPESCDPAAGCQAGTPPDCRDGIPCTNDSCNPTDDACEHIPNAGGCPDIHIGPAADTCPHDDGAGPVTTCDFTGITGLADAAASAPPEGANFLIYDDLGTLAVYTACTLDIPGRSHVTAAPNVDPANVHIYCDAPDTLTNGVLHLDGDYVHIENLTIVVIAGSRTSISSWTAFNDNTITTGGHLIENITSMALMPEIWGHNSIQEPAYLGPDCTLRNSYFYGYYENDFDLTNADNSKIIGNTFIYYQSVGDFDVAGSSGVVIANNVFAGLTNVKAEMIIGDLLTTGLTVTGNAIEGFTGVITGLDPADTTNVIQDNTVGPLEMESPYVPLFLSDSAVNTGSVTPGEGVSLDGTPVDGQTDILPGAYQGRSNLSLPRRTTIKVGERNGACSGGCDVIQSAENEIQLAMWTAWPYSTVEIYPSTTPYTGNAIMSWPLTVTGMGAQPEDVILQSGEEEPDWTFYGLWSRHPAVLTVLGRTGDPLAVDNMTLRVDASAVANQHGVMTEYTDPLDMDASYWHTFTRLRVETVNTGAGLDWGFYLGDRVHVQDVLIHGDFHTCIRFGMRRDEDDVTPATTGRVVNMTCRLTSTGGTHDAESGLDVASVLDSRFVNLVIEFPDANVTLYRAQRRSVGDTGATALDVPTSYIAHSVTASNHGTHSDGYDPIDGTYTETELDELAVGTSIFISATDSHLDPACATCDALDRGVDPSTVDADLAAGVSLDGVDRAGMTIDRGCYEEGL